MGHRANYQIIFTEEEMKKPAAMSAQSFRKLLTDRGIKFIDAAAILGVHKNTVSNWTTGKIPIDEANSLLIKKNFPIKV
jgi:DNA-binding transcriptional regulator YiaG